MKDIIILIDQQEIRDFINKLWKTDCIKIASQTKGSWIYQLVENYSRLPRIVFSISDPIEVSHFTSSFNCLSLREYDSAGVNDVYYIHEMSHITTMVHKRYPTHQEWKQHKCDNEMYATLMSDVFIYFRYPEMRHETFAFEIWADRFLTNCVTMATNENETNREFFLRDENDFFEVMKNKKVSVLSQNFEDLDFCEADNYNYEFSNVEWCDMWQPHYEELEWRLTDFEEQAQLDRKGAILSLKDWLLEKGEVPWRDMAEQWAEIYKKKKQDEAVARKSILKENYIKFYSLTG